MTTKQRLEKQHGRSDQQKATCRLAAALVPVLWLLAVASATGQDQERRPTCSCAMCTQLSRGYDLREPIPLRFQRGEDGRVSSEEAARGFAEWFRRTIQRTVSDSNPTAILGVSPGRSGPGRSVVSAMHITVGGQSQFAWFEIVTGQTISSDSEDRWFEFLLGEADNPRAYPFHVVLPDSLSEEDKNEAHRMMAEAYRRVRFALLRDGDAAQDQAGAWGRITTWTMPPDNQ